MVEWRRGEPVPEKMTPEEAVAALELLAGPGGDPVRDHEDGNAVLCSLLRFLGHGDVSDAWRAESGGDVGWLWA